MLVRALTLAAAVGGVALAPGGGGTPAMYGAGRPVGTFAEGARPTPLATPASDTILWTPPALRPRQFLQPASIPAPPPARFGRARVLLELPRPEGDPVGAGVRGGVEGWADRALDRIRAAAEAGEGEAFGLGPFGAVVPSLAAQLRRRSVRSAVLAAGAPTGIPDVVERFTDLGFEVRGVTELGGDWTRFRPCDAAVQRTCDPTLLPQIRPEIQFGVQVGGTISDRIAVDVDYDQAREFQGANRVRLSYQGLPGEFVRSVDVGDVSLDLPASRFLTQGIPSGNFGFQSAFEAGPLEIRSLWAQQNGAINTRELELAGAPGQQSFVQEDTLVVDDADYSVGRFFFLVDPEALEGFPHVDVLALAPSAAPLDLLPGAEPLQLYRSERSLSAQQQVEGYIQADASRERNGDQVTESAWFRYLQPGVDYYLHPSGLWIALRSPLQGEEILAATYVTAAGDTIGDYNPERIYNEGGRPQLRLIKASAGFHQPGRPTWDLEMHQVYRVSGSDDVDPGSLDVTISLGEASAGRTFTSDLRGSEITWLRLFGLDEEPPLDRLDRAPVFRPALDSFQDQPPVSGTYLIFPTLRPFEEPPPVPGFAYTAEETREILGSDANLRIYRSDDPFERENGGLFRIGMSYRIRSQGLISTFSLGALGIREGSERIVLGNRTLIRGTDYEIDYDLGQVTLRDPRGLFALTGERRIRATWEQRAQFQAAPASVFGMNARYGLGNAGAVHLLGLYQSEQALFRRPDLGLEPTAIGLGGLNGEVALEAPWLDDLLGRIPFLRAGEGSGIRIDGELAASAPNPNTQGDVYLDDFDGANRIPLSLRQTEWTLGSRIEERLGVEDLLPMGPGGGDAARLTWQHTWIVEGAAGDSLGVFQGFDPREVDEQINVQGSAIRETGLLLDFQPNVIGEPSWRSVTTVLSEAGQDLTRSDFLEFYVAGGGGATLVLDLGSVSEDAYFVDDRGRLNGVKETGAPWGLGVLDLEADPRRGEVWGDAADRRGVWDESCEGQRGRVFRIGDPRANCTRSNGRPDGEDLDQDGNLDTSERHRRFVVRLDGSSPWLARSRTETGTDFQLYRIPLQGPGALEVGGPLTDADRRAVKHLRVTVVASRPEEISIVRLSIVGSRWIKRALSGVITGIGGVEEGLTGRVEVGPVSRLTDGTEYQAPPGVLEQLDDPTQAYGGQGVEFNEKGLKIEFEDVASGHRAEVYNRFTQRPRDFLAYGQARLWVVARQGDWDAQEPVDFFFKVGTDPDNFYLYRRRIDPRAGLGGVVSEDWLPEILIDFEEWLDLRRLAEERILVDPPDPTGPPLILWNADSTYAIALRNRARAPNLVAVRELSFGVLNRTGRPVGGEVWVNELRLSDALRRPGLAGAVSVELEAGDVLSVRGSWSRRGAYFRQLEGNPTFQTDGALDVAATLRLDRLTPESWGLEMPVTVAHSRSRQDPTFLARSDVRADRLDGLRSPRAGRTRVEATLRRAPAEPDGLGDVLLGGIDVRTGFTRISSTSITTEQEARGFDAFVGFTHGPERRALQVFPGFLGDWIRALLPGFLESRVADARLRWSPERMRFGTEFVRFENEIFRYDRIVRLAGDSLVRPSRSPRRNLEAVAEVTFRPFESVSAGFDLVSGRDLLDPRDASSEPQVQDALRAERLDLVGVDLGWEVERNLRTRLGFRPALADWLRGDVRLTTLYASIRNPRLTGRGEGPDSALALLRNVNGQRNLTASISFEPRRLVQDRPPPRPGDPFEVRIIQAVADAMDPFSITWTDGIVARYDRDVVDPGARFQLGLGRRDDFLTLDGDTAATLTDRTIIVFRGGLRLPAGVFATMAFDRSEATTLDVRSDRETRGGTWPDVRVGVRDVTLPWIDGVVEALTAQAGMTLRSRTLTYGGLANQLRDREDQEVPVDLSIRWAGGVTTTYRGRFRDGEGRDPTGGTERDGVSHALTLNSTFLPPLGLDARLDRPVRLSLSFQYVSEVECRSTAGRERCVPFIDQLNRSVNLSMDSAISSLELGLQASWVDRRSFVGRRAGSSQFQLGVFGQFVLSGGQLPVRSPF